MNKTILIFGATGFIGSHLVERLLSDGHKVIVLLKGSLNDTWRIKESLGKVIVYDTDIKTLNAPFEENDIDIVINLVTDFGRKAGAQPHDIVETNVVLALRLASVAAQYGVGHYFNTDSSLDPSVSLYAYSKSVCSAILKKEFAEKSRIKVFNLKLSNTYGENDDPSKFVSLAIAKLRNNETLDMTGGEQQLDLIYVKDCVSALAHLIEYIDDYTETFEEFEIGTGETISLRDFVESVKVRLDSKSVVNYGVVPYRDNEQMFSCANIAKLNGWKPKFRVSDVDFSKF